ncbi:diacylglycerol kinase, partial [Caballeronia sp. M23-90]
MTPAELSPTPSEAAPQAHAPRTIAADAPFFIVMNAGSGRKQSDETRAALERMLGEAGRKFEIRLVDNPAELADTAAQAVRDAKAQNGVVV